MKLIDKRIAEIVAGYDLILKAETGLRSHWRSQLIEAYAQRRQTLDQEQARNRRWQKTPIIGAVVGAFLVLLGFGFAATSLGPENPATLLSCCGAPLVVVLGILLMGAAGFSFLSPSKKPIRVPVHPLRSGSTGIYPDLRQAWLQGLCGEPETEVPDYPGYYQDNEQDYGAEGERQFIHSLKTVCAQNDLILARAMQRRNEDVDLILIGTKGIWVFEVKHWSGEVYWDDRGWRRVQTYFERGGVETTKEVSVGEPPDQQWVRAAAEVSRTLQNHVPQIFEKYPSLEKVRGGIVFTHPDALLKFQPGRPTFWGPANFWLKTLDEFEPQANLDQRSALQLLAALLNRHHQLAPADEKRSMVLYAQNLIKEVEVSLNEWVES